MPGQFRKRNLSGSRGALQIGGQCCKPLTSLASFGKSSYPSPLRDSAEPSANADIHPDGPATRVGVREVWLCVCLLIRCGDDLWVELVLVSSGRCGSGREPGEAGHVGDQVGEPEPGRARARSTERMIKPRRHFWRRRRARSRPHPCPGDVAAVMCGGIGLARGFGRWKCGTSSRRASSARWRPSGRRCRPGRRSRCCVDRAAYRAGDRRSGSVGHREAADEAVPAIVAEVIL